MFRACAGGERKGWWSLGRSNCKFSYCERDAFPVELRPPWHRSHIYSKTKHATKSFSPGLIIKGSKAPVPDRRPRSALIDASIQVCDQNGRVIGPLILKPYFYGFTSLYWSSILSVNHELKCSVFARPIKKKVCEVDPLIYPLKLSDATPGGHHSHSRVDDQLCRLGALDISPPLRAPPVRQKWSKHSHIPLSYHQVGDIAWTVV